MTTATLVLVILLWPLCLFIIGLILLQGGAGDISSAFGGGGQLDSTLGVGAGRKMSKLTAWLGGIFLLIVLALSVPHKGDFSKIAGSAPVPKTEPKPVGAPLVIPPAATPAPASVPTLTPESAAPATPATQSPATQPAPAPAAPAPVGVLAPTPAAPVTPAVSAPAAQPVPAAQPAAAPTPAAPPVQSGVKLDEPAKQ